MRPQDHFDLIVIGDGPAGVTAALRARELVRGLGIVPISQEWLTLNAVRGTEWERKHD